MANQPDLAELRDLIARHCTAPRLETAVPRVRLLRAEAPTRPAPLVYDANVCFIAQGAKRVAMGGRSHDYDAGKYLAVSVDLAATGQIVRASPRAPMLALCLRFDRALLASVLLEHPASRAPASATGAGLAVSPITPELLDPVLRLARLLDRPRDAAALAPLAERELLYRLLDGEQGALLRRIALADSPAARVGRAIGWIREHHREPLRVEAVAKLAGMSPSSFHRHFKAVTAMSPLQFQKRIRLNEARRLLLSGEGDAASAGFAVGYESPSQFSREYSRLFGEPPRRDALRLRQAARDGVAVVAQE